MNQSHAQWTKLPPDNLCGTDHFVTYIAYRRSFNGEFDAAGEPIIENACFNQIAPVVRCHEGQKFEGFWLPHNPIGLLVMDTGHLRLAFPCPDSLRHPLASPELPRLRIEAVVVHERRQALSTAWRIYQYASLSGEPARLLSPNPGSPLALAPSNTGSRWVSLENALSHVAEEKAWVLAQRRELAPPPCAPLTSQTAREIACFDVLGDQYRRVIDGKWLFEDMLRSIDTGQPSRMGKPIVIEPVTRAEVMDYLARHAPEYERLAQLTHHSKLQPIIAERTEWLLARDQALQRRLRQLEKLQANLFSQTANPEQRATQHMPESSPKKSATLNRGFRIRV